MPARCSATMTCHPFADQSMLIMLAVSLVAWDWPRVRTWPFSIPAGPRRHLSHGSVDIELRSSLGR